MIRLKILRPIVLIILTITYLCILIRSYEKHTKVGLFGRLQTYLKSIPEDFISNSSWITEFRERECKIYSQNGEDGVLLWLFTHIGTIHSPPRFVEFGVENGMQCNTRFLRQHLGWKGLMMDGSNENLTLNLHREMISPANINILLAKYQTPSLIDLLSIDVE